MFWMELSFIVFIILHDSTCLDEVTYSQVVDLSGKIPTGVGPITVRSLSDCAASCSSAVICQGFYYSQTNRECFLDTKTPFVTFQNDSAGMYFAINEPILTNVSITLVSYAVISNTSCPARFQKDVILMGNSGNNYTLAFFNVTVNQSEAEDMCDTRGMVVLTISSDVKRQDLGNGITNCPDYYNNDYWSDAKRAITEPGTPWRDSVGVEIPVGYWCNGNVGHATNEYCARWDVTCGFTLKDRLCEDIKHSVICE